MSLEFLENFRTVALKAALLAGEEVRKIYDDNDYQVEYKNDNSPITIADRKAHNIISEILKDTQIPLLSEEGADIPYEIRSAWKYFWLIDPIDGTKEFIKRNGEFTVNIALIENGKPALGVIYTPVDGKLYFGYSSTAYFFKNDKKHDFDIEQTLKNIELYKVKLPLLKQAGSLRIAASRSNLNQETKNYIGKIEKHYENIEMVCKGSSLKFCLVAEGSADIYPRFSTTMEWDTAAGHALVNAAGGSVFQYNSNEELIYNKKDLKNPWFIVKNHLIT